MKINKNTKDKIKKENKKERKGKEIEEEININDF